VRCSTATHEGKRHVGYTHPLRQAQHSPPNSYSPPRALAGKCLLVIATFKYVYIHSSSSFIPSVILTFIRSLGYGCNIAAMGAESSKKSSSKASVTTRVHIADQEISWTNWYQHVNWLNVTLIIMIPMIGLYYSTYTPLYHKTAIWSVLYYFATGFGITAGKLQ